MLCSQSVTCILSAQASKISHRRFRNTVDLKTWASKCVSPNSWSALCVCLTPVEAIAQQMVLAASPAQLLVPLDPVDCGLQSVCCETLQVQVGEVSVGERRGRRTVTAWKPPAQKDLVPHSMSEGAELLLVYCTDWLTGSRLLHVLNTSDSLTFMEFILSYVPLFHVSEHPKTMIKFLILYQDKFSWWIKIQSHEFPPLSQLSGSVSSSQTFGDCFWVHIWKNTWAYATLATAGH